MILKPQDVLVLLKLRVIRNERWTYHQLALKLGMSPAEVHAAVRRLQAAELAVRQEDNKVVTSMRNMREFLAFGLRYVFVPERGGLTRGMPTLYAAPPLKGLIAATNEPVPVWPDPQGEVRGTSFSPLYRSAPKVARTDPELYELLVLVDAIRGGGAREREIAISMLNTRLTDQGDDRMIQEITSDYLRIGGQLTVSRTELESLATRFHIRKLSLFGSAARGELRPDSDIDLLVEFEPGKAPSLWKAASIQGEFSQLFQGRPVDLVPPEVLRNPFRRKTIEHDLKVLFDEAA